MAGSFMKSNKQILIFTPGFPVDEQDFACIPPLQNYVRELARQPGVKVTVLSLHYPFEARRYHWNGIEVIAMGGANRKYPARVMLWRKAFKVMKQLHREKQFDLIHSFWMHECAMLGNRFARKYKLSQVITLMGQDMKPPNRFVRFVNQQSAKLVSLSDFQPQREEVGIRTPDAIIPFGITDQERNWVVKEEKFIDILGVGSFIPLKGYDRFLRIISKLKEKYPAIKAEIIGDGVERATLQKLISELGLIENVVMPGHLSRKEVFKKMAQSRVFLHTSEYETQGYVFNEALLSGLPIVSTKVGIAQEADYWKVGSSDTELTEAVNYFLNQSVAVPPVANLEMKETVERYLELYDL